MIRLENLIKRESRHIEKIKEMRRNGEEPNETRVRLLTDTRNQIEEIKNMSQLEREFEDAIVHQPPWDYPLIETLLEKGANPNKNIRGAMNLLGLASFWGDTTLTAILLMHGADPNPNPPYLKNPLDSFIYNGNLIGVKLLVEHGSELNLQNGTNFINLATKNSKDNKVEIVSYLISKGAKFDKSTGPKNTEDLLIQYGIYEQVMSNIGATKILGNWRKRAEEPYSRARYNTMMDQYDEMIDSSERRQTLGDFARSRLSGRIKVGPEERKYLEKSLAMGEKIGPEYLRSPFSLSSPKRKTSPKKKKSPRRKSPRRKSPRRKSPRRKSPRRKSPRRKSPRRKRTRMNAGDSRQRILPIRQSLSSRNQKKSKSLEERVSVSGTFLDKTIIGKSDEPIRVFNVWVSDGEDLGQGGGGETLVYLAVKGNQVPGYIGGEIEETGELKPGQTLVISTTTDHPYPENSDLHDYSGSSIEIFDGEPYTSDESLFPSFPEGQRTRMQYDKVTYEEALELLEDTDGIVKINL